jgi:TolB-like protein
MDRRHVQTFWGVATWRRVALLAVCFFLSPPLRAGGYAGIAKDLSRAAKRAGMSRVAVLPFEPADESPGWEGRIIAERLTTRLVATSRVQVVERNLLGKFFEEFRLRRIGALASEPALKPGVITAVDGIVTGSFLMMGHRLLIEARLIDLATGGIVAAAESREDGAGVAETSDEPTGIWSRLAAILEPGYDPERTVDPLDKSLSRFLFQPSSGGDLLTADIAQEEAASSRR